MLKNWLAKFKRNIATPKLVKSCGDNLFYTFLLLIFCTTIFTFQNSLAAEVNTDDADYVSTNEIMQEIEKTLLFSSSKSNTTSNNFYKSKKDSSDSKAGEEIDPADNIEFNVAEYKKNNRQISINQKQQIAYNALNSGQYEVAIALYKQILASSKHDDYTKFALAATYQRLGQFKQAKALYYELLKKDPANRDEIISNLLAIIVEESPRQAIYLLSRLATQNPDSAFIIAQCAMAYNNVKNYDQAVYFLNQAISLDPKKNDYKFNLAVVYDKMGDYDKALNLYSEVLDNYDDQTDLNIPVAQIHKRIDSIKNKF